MNVYDFTMRDGRHRIYVGDGVEFGRNFVEVYLVKPYRRVAHINQRDVVIVDYFGEQKSQPQIIEVRPQVEESPLLRPIEE